MCNELYELWLQKADKLYQNELTAISEDDVAITDRFYRNVAFGTGGMRGELGAGTNRINVHTIRLVAEGLARLISTKGVEAKVRGVVIAYDTRHFSQDFAYETAGVLAAHGIQSYVFNESRPTPELSFAIRYLGAYAGVVITASHNPKQYNGFKVYGEDGAQLTPQYADEIVAQMEAVDDLFTIQALDKSELLASSFCVEILEKIDDAYNCALQELMLRRDLTKNLQIVYTPLHGAGLVPTIRALSEAGFSNVQIVKEQAIQEGDFSTVTYPNPEDEAAFTLAMELGHQVGADLLLATDPDADRLGVAVKEEAGYRLLTGNQLGALLLHYLVMSKKEVGTLPENGVILKTIVTSELGTAVAKSFGIETVNTLTGFKFIAEKIAEYEETQAQTFLFGFEESYGYLAGDFVRDKDAVQIALLTSEMAAYYHEKNQTLLDALNDLYKEYGYYKEKLLSFTFEGMEGQKKIIEIMDRFREFPLMEMGGIPIVATEDYVAGISRFVNGDSQLLTLPTADVLKFILADGSWICIRPSGTEPKCKVYIGVCKSTDEEAQAMVNDITENLLQMIQ